MILRRAAALVFVLAAMAVWGTRSAPAAEFPSPHKALVLAWDGAVPSFVEELLKAGKLPHLARLIAGGAFAADVLPAFPSKTAPGFASLITGAPPRVTGISGNRVPRMPRHEHTVLESLSAFSEAPLQAESIWSAAHRAGKRVVISHMPIFRGEGSEHAARFAGYDTIAGRDGIITPARAVKGDAALSWTEAPPSGAVPLEFSFTVGGSHLFALLIDDPADDTPGYDTIILAADRSGKTIQARLKPGPAGPGGEVFWSEPIAIKSASRQDARVYFRLFDLKADGSDFFLYHTRPVRELVLPEAEVRPGSIVRAFVGNGASFLYQQGAFGRTLANGGSGAAETRYLDTIQFAQHQLMETTRWALEHLPWDVYFAYTPFPDEAEHSWRGHLDPSLPGHRSDLAERLRPFLERVYATSDDFLGMLLTKRPPDAFVALISDHGLQGVNRRVALNAALARAQLLVLDKQNRVDLSKTRIVYPPVNSGYLLLNGADRKGGIVKPDERSEVVRLTKELLFSLRDGERQIVTAIFDAVQEGEDRGIGGDWGGDLYIELAPGYDFDPRPSAASLITVTEPYGTHGASPEQASMRTLMVLNGPGIHRGQNLNRVRIIDFAPTLAWLLHLPRPKDATGRVLFEAFIEPR